MKTKLYLLSAVLIAAILFGFVFQESQKFYYGFNEKILLTEVENKLVVRYSPSISKDNVSNALTRVHATVQQTWKDEYTVVLSTTSKADRNALLENLRNAPEVSSFQPMYAISTGLEMIITDEIVIKFKESILARQQQEINQKFGVTLVKDGDTYLLFRVPKSVDALSIANQYQESGLVEFSHPNFIIEIDKHQQVIPNDPYFVNQFTLHNTGQVFNDGHFGTADADIDAPECWPMITGNNNIVIAVLDEGVTADHPDLPNTRQVRLNGSNFANGDPNNPSPTGNRNHGNACAGVISATQNNNQGIAGICPNCRIMPIRIFNSTGTAVATNRIADAINFARTNGADIISNSWGAATDNPNFAPDIVTAIQTATTQGRIINGVARGCVVVFSAGNNQVNNGIVHFPANVNVPGVLTVGASDRNDLKSFYSPLGDPASPNNQVLDVTAPSHRAYPFQITGETFEAWSIDIPNNTGYNPWPTGSITPPPVGEQLPNAGVNFQSYTGRFGGTSHSCPVVAGVAALMLSANPNLTQQQVFNILTSKADKVGGYTYTNGRSNQLGFGRVNACQAVREVYRLNMSIASSTGLICSSNAFVLQNAPQNSSLISWTTNVPTGLSISNSGVATRINDYDGLAMVYAWLNTGCGISGGFNRLVWVGRPVSSISGQGLVYPGQLYTYNTIDPNFNGAGGYTWVVEGGTIYGGGGPSDTSITIFWNESGYIELTSSNFCGTSTGHLDVTVDLGGGCNPCQIMQTYPNPSSEELNVTLNKDLVTDKQSNEILSSNVSLVDYMQNVVYSTSTNNLEIKIPTNNLPQGIYVLKVVNKTGAETRRILIKR